MSFEIPQYSLGQPPQCIGLAVLAVTAVIAALVTIQWGGRSLATMMGSDGAILPGRCRTNCRSASERLYARYWREGTVDPGTGCG